MSLFFRVMFKLLNARQMAAVVTLKTRAKSERRQLLFLDTASSNSSGTIFFHGLLGLGSDRFPSFDNFTHFVLVLRCILKILRADDLQQMICYLLPLYTLSSLNQLNNPYLILISRV